MPSTLNSEIQHVAKTDLPTALIAAMPSVIRSYIDYQDNTSSGPMQSFRMSMHALTITTLFYRYLHDVQAARVEKTEVLRAEINEAEKEMDTVILGIKRAELQQLNQDIAYYDQGIFSIFKKLNTPIKTISTALLFLSLGGNFFEKGSLAFDELLVNLGVFYLLNQLAAVSFNALSSALYQADPELFNVLRLARAAAVVTATANLFSSYVSAEVNAQIKDMRAETHPLPGLTSMNARMTAFVDSKPTIKIPFGQPASLENIQLMDNKGHPIPFQTHSGLEAKAQWHLKTNHGQILHIYQSARGLPYIAITEAPAWFSTLANPFLNVGLISAAYAMMGPMAAFMATLFTQVSHAMADVIPKDKQQAMDQYYEDTLQHCFLNDFTQNKDIDPSRVITAFHSAFKLNECILKTFSRLSTAQRKYLGETMTSTVAARLNHWKTAAEHFLNLKTSEGLAGASGLPEHIVKLIANPIADAVLLAAKSTTSDLNHRFPQFAGIALNWIHGLDPELNPLGRSFANMVFKPGYVNSILTELKQYALNTGEHLEKQLIAALNTQLNDAYNAGVTTLTKAEKEVKKEAIDYVLKNAPTLVKTVEAITQAKQFFETQEKAFDKDFTQHLTTVACNILGKNECDSINHAVSVFTNDLKTTDQHLQSFIKSMREKVAGIFKLTLRQKLSPAEKLAYAHDLQSMAVDFAFVSNIAGVLLGSKMAGKIQAVGGVTIKLFATLSSFSKMGSVMEKIGSFMTKIIPALAVVSAVFDMISIFSGGGSSAEETEQMLQVYMQQIMDEFHVVIKLEVDIYKAVGQLDAAMQADFTQVMQWFQLLNNALRQSMEITQRLLTEEKMQLSALSVQGLKQSEDIEDAPFRKAKAGMSLIYRSPTAIRNPLRNQTIQGDLNEFYQHAATESVQDRTRTEAFMVEVDQSSTRINTLQEVEANNLQLTAPENSIRFYQNLFGFITQQFFSPLANGLMFRNGAAAFVTAYFRFVSENILFSTETMIQDMLKVGVSLIQFGLAVRHADPLWDKIMTDTNTTLSNFISIAPTVFQNAWEYYATNSQTFKEAYIQPMQGFLKDLVQQVNDGHYSQVPLAQYFSDLGDYCRPWGRPLLSSLDAVMLQRVLEHNDYKSAQISVIHQVDVTQFILDLFNKSATSPIPVISVDTDGRTVDFSPIVTIQREVADAIRTGIIKKKDIQFSHVVNGISASPNIVITGVFLKPDGTPVTFFTGTYYFPLALMNNRAGQILADDSYTCVVQLCSDSVLSGNCIADCSNPWHSPQTGFATYENFYLIPVIAVENFLGFAYNCFASYFHAYPAKLITYTQLATSLYNGILTNTYETSLRAQAQPIQNTANWEAERIKLKAHVEADKAQIAQQLIEDMNRNPNLPAYQALSGVLRALQATYNLVSGWLHFGFADYTKGAHDPHQNPLLVPVNPWHSNGTVFDDQHGVQVDAVPGNLTWMQSQYAVPLENKVLRIRWSALNPGSAKMGLQLGNKTLIEVDPSLHPGVIYDTRVVQTQTHRYNIVTSCYPQGEVVNETTWNTTETQGIVRAFVVSDDATQGIYIMNATSLDKNATVAPKATVWESVNTPLHHPTQFTDNQVRFFNVNAGYSQLQSNQTTFVMDSEIDIVWQANSDLHHNMTVSINLGEQHAIAEFKIGNAQFHPNKRYYTRIQVTHDTITCVTCRDGFVSQGGVIVNERVQNNNFVTDASSLAIRISQSNAPDGAQSVSIYPIQIRGFETSILPQPMSTAHWVEQNTTQPIVSTPNGLTLSKAQEQPHVTLISKEDHVLRMKEIRMKWQVSDQANVTLQLAGNTIATFVSPTPNKACYVRVTVFDEHVFIATSNSDYDVYSDAMNVTQTRIPADLSIGSLAWVVTGDNAVNFTLNACELRDAQHTVLTQKAGGLLSPAGFMQEMLSLSAPEEAVALFEDQMARLGELAQSRKAAASQPDEIDPDYAKAMQDLDRAQRFDFLSSIKPIVTPAHDDYPSDPVDFSASQTGSESRTASEVKTETETDIKTETETEPETVTTTVTETETASPHTSTDTPTQTNSDRTKTKTLPEPEETQNGSTAKIVAGVVCVSVAGLVIGGGFFALKRRAEARRSLNDERLEEGEAKELGGYHRIQ